MTNPAALPLIDTRSDGATACAPRGRSARVFAVLAGLCALMLAACSGEAQTVRATSASKLPASVGEERVLGASDAPITVIEYASVMCGFCEYFHVNVFGEIKEKYIDSGHVRFVFREIPTAPVQLSYAGFLTARCVPEERYFDMLDVQFRQRSEIIRRVQEGIESNPNIIVDTYWDLARSAGLSEDTFRACLRDQDEIERIQAVGDAANKTWGITGTPSFVVNGRYQTGVEALAEPVGELTIADFDALFAPLLATD